MALAETNTRSSSLKYYDTWIVSFKARWGIYSKKVLKELERLHHENQPKTTSRRKSKV